MKDTRGQVLAYIRTSTEDQNSARQQGLKDGAHQTFEEKESTGRKRPAKEDLLKFARSGDHIRVWSIDRWARSLLELKSDVFDLTQRGVSIEFVSEGLKFTPKEEENLYSDLMLNLLGSIYEFERKMMLQRQREGIARAKAAGKYKGRKAITLTPEQRANMHEWLEAGVPKARIAQKLGISRSRLYEELRTQARGATDPAGE